MLFNQFSFDSALLLTTIIHAIICTIRTRGEHSSAQNVPENTTVGGAVCLRQKIKCLKFNKTKSKSENRDEGDNGNVQENKNTINDKDENENKKTFSFSLSWNNPMVRFGDGKNKNTNGNENRNKSESKNENNNINNNNGNHHDDNDSEIAFSDSSCDLELPRYYSRFFGNFGDSGENISIYGLLFSHNWEERIVKWQEKTVKNANSCFDTEKDGNGVPDYYRSQLFNELYFLVDGGSVWTDSSEGR